MKELQSAHWAPAPLLHVQDEMPELAGASLFTIAYNKRLFVPVKEGISNINISQAPALSPEKTILTCLINLNCLPRFLCFAQYKHLRP